MPTTSEYNQFRRLVGDFPDEAIDDSEIDSWLNDATRELTSDFVNASGAPLPVEVFDTLVVQYHPEAILKAAINWWWNKAAVLSDRHSAHMGEAAQNVSEKWDRAMAMIQKLEDQYAIIQELQTDITIGNLSRFSKTTLTRLGGRSEEDILDGP